MPAPSRSRNGLRRRAEASPNAAQLNDKTQGTCSFYPPDAGGCRAPRSCYDCLNTQLDQEPDGCMIDEVGRCVSVLDNYDPWLDFRVAQVGGQATNGSRSIANGSEVAQPPHRILTDQDAVELQFPAVNTTYCEDDDVLFNEDQLADGGFMYGTGGCVFVAVCEVPSWAYAVGGSDCTGLVAADWDGPDDKGSRAGKNDTNQGYLVFWCVAIAILLTLVATLTMVITIHHHNNKRRFDELRRRTIVVGAPLASVEHTMTPKSSKTGGRLLNLFGWEAMRAGLIEKERQDIQERLCAHACQVSGNSLPVGSPSTNYLQFVGAEPSAPVMSPIESSAPRLTDC
ncbi:hypothetical protein PRNP1_012436 [Phytophthora ramorum]|uniref:uncharacterized protein n=1 Tax=Phytophthora ramorum TaxID=164328 RepID=UPI0030B57387|nr:hypothetical protein KRP23_11906 [Phytophthora ramorum]